MAKWDTVNHSISPLNIQDKMLSATRRIVWRLLGKCALHEVSPAALKLQAEQASEGLIINEKLINTMLRGEVCFVHFRQKQKLKSRSFSTVTGTSCSYESIRIQQNESHPFLRLLALTELLKREHSFLSLALQLPKRRVGTQTLFCKSNAPDDECWGYSLPG